MLSRIQSSIIQLDDYPEFGRFYQQYVSELEDSILENEFSVNRNKMTQLKNFNCVLTQLNELTEELKRL